MKPALYRALGALLILGAAVWSGYALIADAPVVDESPHLAAGVSYVQLLQYRLNPEHPPLEKLAAGLGASFADPVLPTDAAWWPDGINEQWRAGEALLGDGRSDAGNVLAYGRAGVLLLNFLFLLLGWRAVARVWGEAWALATLVLITASPFFLGHAHLITTDIAASGAGALACAAFAAFLQRTTWQRGAIAALAFGVAQLAKFSLVLLIPTFVLVALVVAYQAYGCAWRKVLARVIPTLLVIAAGFAFVVYPTYLVLTWNGSSHMARRDAEFLLGSFAGGPSDRLLKSPARYAADLTIAASGHKLTQPMGTYALGVLMVVQRSAGGNTSYFNGEVGSSGSKLYFPLVYTTKETLPALLITGLGLAFFLRRMRGTWRSLGQQATPHLVLGTFAALYVLSTFRSSLNIGIRHIFPVILIGYLFALAGWRTEATRDRRYSFALAILLVLHLGVGIAALPHPLAYYNPLAGGTARGYTIASDSNYDWGQDALRLREWIDAHPEAGTMAVDLFGGSEAEALLGERAISWWSARGNPQAYGIRWIAISNSLLLSATQPLVPREPRLTIDEYRWLSALRGVPHGTLPEPDARAGTSIFLYDLSKPSATLDL